jgi:hypothetical protein
MRTLAKSITSDPLQTVPQELVPTPKTRKLTAALAPVH